MTLKKIISSNRLTCLVLVAAGLLAFSLTVNTSFRYLDDQVSILNNPLIRDFSHTKEIFTSSFFGGGNYYRPLVLLSYMLDYHLFELNAVYFHCVNLFLHAVNAVFVFFLTAYMTRERETGFFAALVFAIHPVHWEAVSHISGRSILLSAFFVLGAFFCYCLSREKAGRFFYGGSLVLFLCGLLSKESAGVFPFVLFAYAALTAGGEKFRLALRAALRHVWPYFAILAGFILWRKMLGIDTIYPWANVKEMGLGVLTFLRACGTYLRILVFPVDLHFDRSRVMFHDFFTFELFVTLAVVVVLAAAVFTCFRRGRKIMIFFLLWTILELLPVSQIVTTIGVSPGVISTAEHFLYLASIGIFVPAVYFFKNLKRRAEEKGWIKPLTTSFVLWGFLFFLFLTSITQSLYARNSFLMLQRSYRYQPWNARVTYLLGLEYAQVEKFKEAEGYFRLALQKKPDDTAARIALGRALCDQGRYREGIDEYEKVRDPGLWGSFLERNFRDAQEKMMQQNKMDAGL